MGKTISETTELVKIKEENGQQLVDARELHIALGSKRDFSAWIKARIEKYELSENQDFITAPQKYRTVNGGYAVRTEYALTLDTAKELAMVENNEQGRRVRRYFIECERRFKQLTPSYQIQDPIARAEAWIAEQKYVRELEDKAKRQHAALVQSAEEIKELSHAITEMQPKVTYYDVILRSKGTCTVTQIAQDYGMSAKSFNAALQKLHIQRKVGTQWILYSKYLSEGYVHSKPIDIVRADGTHETKYNTEWTPKGRIFLYGELKEHGILPLVERE